MKQVISDPIEVFGELERDFWGGIAAWCEYQDQVLLRAGADAADWDAVNRAKGSRAVLKTLRRLQADYEQYLVARELPKG